MTPSMIIVSVTLAWVCLTLLLMFKLASDGQTQTVAEVLHSTETGR